MIVYVIDRLYDKECTCDILRTNVIYCVKVGRIVPTVMSCFNLRISIYAYAIEQQW
jgi:hypothetical protein